MKSTKNVQIIDGATNCTYSIYAFTGEQFALPFPEEGQDVEFIEDVMGRLSPDQRERAFSGAWTRPVRKEGVLPVEAGNDVAGPPHSPSGSSYLRRV